MPFIRMGIKGTKATKKALKEDGDPDDAKLSELAKRKVGQLAGKDDVEVKGRAEIKEERHEKHHNRR